MYLYMLEHVLIIILSFAGDHRERGQYLFKQFVITNYVRSSLNNERRVWT